VALVHQQQRQYPDGATCHLPFRPLQSLHEAWVPKFFEFMGFNLLLAFLSSLSLFLISPAASGSGIPDVKVVVMGACHAAEQLRQHDCMHRSTPDAAGRRSRLHAGIRPTPPMALSASWACRRT
jgi:hypothetical protein